MKSAYYTAAVTHAYRMAIDAYLRSPEEYEKRIPEFLAEVAKVSHRRYYTGFFLDGRMGAEGQNQESSQYIRGYTFAASCLEGDAPEGMTLVAQRNNFRVGDVLEILSPGESGRTFEVTDILDAETGEHMPVAPHPMQKLYISCPVKLKPGDMLRRRENN